MDFFTRLARSLVHKVARKYESSAEFFVFLLVLLTVLAHYYLENGKILFGGITAVVFFAVFLFNRQCAKTQRKIERQIRDDNLFREYMQKLLRTVSAMILSSAKPPIHHVRTYITVLNENSHEHHIIYSDGFEQLDYDKDLRFPKNGGWVGLAYEEKEPVMLDLTASKGDQNYRYYGLFKTEYVKLRKTLRSAYSVPIVVNSKIVAILSFDSDNTLEEMKFKQTTTYIPVGLAALVGAFVEAAKNNALLGSRSDTAPIAVPVERKPMSKMRKRVLAIASGLTLLIMIGVLLNAYYSSIPERLAVLPFQMIGIDGDDDYISERITEGLIHDLAVGGKYWVVARQDTYDKKNTDSKTLDELGKTLRAKRMIVGTIKRHRDGYIVDVEMFAFDNGRRSLWTEHYERDEKHLPDVYQDISRTINDPSKAEKQVQANVRD